MLRTAALILTLLTSGCAGFSGPLIDPHAAWNPQYFDGKSYPCPQPKIFPYFRGWNADGTAECTVRPYDADYWDVDELSLP